MSNEQFESGRPMGSNQYLSQPNNDPAYNAKSAPYPPVQNNPQGYQMDPAYQNQPPNQVIVVKDQAGGKICPKCNSSGNIHSSYKVGVAAIAWGTVLCLLTGFCCFWIPCVVDDCKDYQMSCIKCGHVYEYRASSWCCCD